MSADNYILIEELEPKHRQNKDEKWLVIMMCASSGEEITRLGAFKNLVKAIKKGQGEFVEYGLHFKFLNKEEEND